MSHTAHLTIQMTIARTPAFSSMNFLFVKKAARHWAVKEDTPGVLAQNLAWMFNDAISVIGFFNPET